jgi:hypothetical protein
MTRISYFCPENNGIIKRWHQSNSSSFQRWQFTMRHLGNEVISNGGGQVTIGSATCHLRMCMRNLDNVLIDTKLFCRNHNRVLKKTNFSSILRFIIKTSWGFVRKHICIHTIHNNSDILAVKMAMFVFANINLT